MKHPTRFLKCVAKVNQEMVSSYPDLTRIGHFDPKSKILKSTSKENRINIQTLKREVSGSSCGLNSTEDRIFHKIRINLTDYDRPSKTGCHSTKHLKEEKSHRRKSLEKNEVIMFQSLLRAYQRTLSNIEAPKLLSLQNTVQVLNELGYLQQPIINRLDYKLVSGVFHMIGGSDNQGVRRQNLFQFIKTISNISGNLKLTLDVNKTCDGLHRDEETNHLDVPIEIGQFDEQGFWYFNQEEQNQIRRVFSKLTYNKISNGKPINRRRSSESISYRHTPAILESSRQLALIRRQKITEQAAEISDQCVEKPKDVADMLQIQNKVRKSKIELLCKEKASKQLKNCTFRPSVNKSRQSSNSSGKDRCQLLYDLSRKKSLSSVNKTRLSTTDERQIQKLKQCTFRPETTVLRQSNKPIKVKNCEKIVSRMVEGRNQRRTSNILKQRGYPADVHWGKYVQEFKKPRICIGSSNTTTANNSPRKPIVTIDIKLDEDNHQRGLQIFEGDSIENLTCKVLVRNRLNYQYFQKLFKLISEVLEQCSQTVVKDGFVFAQ